MTTDHTAPSEAGSYPPKQLLAARRGMATAATIAPETLLTPAEMQDRCATLGVVLDPAVALARERLTHAAGSPADTARWASLLHGVAEDQSAAACGDPAALPVLAARGHALLGALLDTQPPWPGIPAIAAAIRARITAYSYFPGRLLVLQRLAGDAGCSRSDVKLALEDLSAENIVARSDTGFWYARDTRPAGHLTERAADLLARVITAGAYPPETVLSRTKLRDLLLVDTGTVHDALGLLTGRSLVHLAQNRYTVLPLASSTHTAGCWPLADAELLGRLPPPRETGAEHSLAVIRRTQQNAVRRYRDGDVLPAAAMSVQEERQGEVLRRLLMSAHNQIRYQDHLDTRLQSCAAWVLACTAMPSPADPEHRLWSFAVTSVAVAGLGIALRTSQPAHRRPW
ncbi:hypothetical protein [Streptomyces sp. NPDC001787]|uniref:hypothetical protein n=1 Tax=Streptomyces sp. NPDC001787 TaxID=3154523 RepID=UPI00332B3116